MADNIVRVSIYNEYSWTPRERLREFVAWANTLLDGIPEPFRDSARMDLDYDDGTNHMSVWYDRPETSEEAAERTAKAQQAREERERNYRAMYEALKWKYDKPPNGQSDGADNA